MDIDLLSKMVKELILDNDEVSLPGVGSFVAELVPSSFSDKGYTINPPYKRLSFRKKADASDNVLIDFYAKSNNVDKETASKIVIDFLSEMQKVLELRKSIVFPGLGKLRATKENIFFFVADEDLDIYPEGFGLEPISLKTHEETPAEVSATIAALQDILNPEETEGQSGSGEQSGSEEPSEAVSGPEDAPEVTGGVQPESSREAEVESDSEPQPEQQATAEESDHQSENESQHDEESEQETAQHVEASSSEDAPEVTGDVQPESSLEAEVESDSELQPEQQATAEESGHQSENESQSEAEGEQENEPQQEPASESDRVEETTEPVTPIQPETEPEQPRTEPAKKSRKEWKALIWTAVAIAALAVTFIVGFVILAHIAPDFIDSILYTQEELEIINH